LAESYSLERNWREMDVASSEKAYWEEGLPDEDEEEIILVSGCQRNRFLFGSYGKDVYIEPEW
jgi:hypothetical protein